MSLRSTRGLLHEPQIYEVRELDATLKGVEIGRDIPGELVRSTTLDSWLPNKNVFIQCIYLTFELDNLL
ncbi:hypothetical protein ACMD2_21891 [Ananas comosus]|uniref:Uncharacterized protein n=1 Tax=Ananas comosus TaxID=4615 RepID=A0A199UE68_ANACO|nr:hypothetical protein ACMD2_21891 [Ananas comosus]